MSLFHSQGLESGISSLDLGGSPRQLSSVNEPWNSAFKRITTAQLPQVKSSI
jgi:hypothetical protein